MVHIAFNIDESYRDKLKVLIKSILANTKSEVSFHVIGLTNFNISGVNNIFCYEAPDLSIIKQETNYFEISTAACYRLYLPDILPENIKKVIYLDTDTIVLDNISKLYAYEPKVIAGVVDPMFIQQANRNKLKHMYINSGVLLMNLSKLREMNYKEILAETQSGDYSLTLIDQDMINIAFADVIQHLPEKWNTYAYVYPQITREMINARENPSIIHWCGTHKPWKPNSFAWRKEDWLKYQN